MGNLDFSANADQLKELATYMASQINVPTIGIGGGYAPIGAIQFFDATVAPQDWLACDGTVYNIADYPQLADYYEAQHGSKNFYGGDGTTTFAVPDLQGEFLRGTGTNSHANQGSGGSVGEHQDGTSVPIAMADNSNMNIAYGDGLISETILDTVFHVDAKKEAGSFRNIQGRSQSFENDARTKNFTSRPTNTSFLICVKAVVAGEVYSTEERVVGTWIDGKPIYQKAIVLESNTSHGETIPIANIDYLIDFGGICYGASSGYLRHFPWITDGWVISLNEWNSNGIELIAKAGGSNTLIKAGSKLWFKYTKTTDG